MNKWYSTNKEDSVSSTAVEEDKESSDEESSLSAEEDEYSSHIQFKKPIKNSNKLGSTSLKQESDSYAELYPRNYTGLKSVTSPKKEISLLSRHSSVPFGQNGRVEENGNLLKSRSNERLKEEVELIYRKIIETDDITKLRAFLMKKLYQGNWKHKVLSLCSAAIKKHQNKITFQDLYNCVRDEAKDINSELKQTMLNEIKRVYYQGSV